MPNHTAKFSILTQRRQVLVKYCEVGRKKPPTRLLSKEETTVHAEWQITGLKLIMFVWLLVFKPVLV